MNRSVLLLAAWLAIFAGPQVTNAQSKKSVVEQAPEFLQPIKSVGRMSGTSVILVTDPADCLDEQAQPIPHCFAVPAQPGQATWNEVDVEAFVVPAKALRSQLILLLQTNLNFTLRNHTAADVDGLFRAQTPMAIESPAFNNVVDPFTGQALNGRWNFFALQRRVVTTLRPNAVHADQITFTRRLGISRTLLKDNLAMTDAQIDEFFNNPITVKMSLAGAARLCENAIFVGFIVVDGS